MPSTAADNCGISESVAVMIASSDEQFRQRIQKRIGRSSGPVTEATGGADALAKLERTPCRRLILDRRLADLNVEELEQMLRGSYPDMEIVVTDFEKEFAELTAPAVEETGICADAGDATTPLIPEEGERIAAADSSEAAKLGVEPLPGMIGSSQAMAEVFRLARLVARRNTPVLVTGETGTGKELVARAIHDLSPRSRGPFVTVNCAAIPEMLLEAELFGHSRGAFTGAVQSRLGRIHSAHRGTLFLDEAGELPLAMQAKLLRFLQYGEVQRLGSPDVFRVDVRVVAATNADLARRVERTDFRADLYYRLSVFPIELPPLKERSEDVLPLALDHLEKLCQEATIPAKTLSSAAQALLKRHNWPGNVRELQHAVERAFILAEERREISAALFHLTAQGPLS